MALAWAIAWAPRPSQVITWLRGDNEPENLTGATMTVKILSLTTVAARAIVGALSVMYGDEGRF